MSETGEEKGRARGWVIAIGSLALLWGVAYLKGRAR